jgi:predicted nucleic acid-binding protein
MRRLKVYLDTSVIGFLFAEDSPDFGKATVEFFERYSLRFDLYASDVVLAEINQDANLNRREKQLSVLKQHPIALLPDSRSDEVETLATIYIDRKVVPPSKKEDALHVAYATVFEMDVLLSWNFKHLSNLAREERILAVNRELGYRYPMHVMSPLGVDYEED